MKGRTSRLFLALSASVLAGSVSVASATPAALPTSPSRGQPPLTALVDVAARRVLVADLVAAAKFGTGAPIDDSAREQVILADVRMRAQQMGIDPNVAGSVFRDQIEANKVVQRGLYALWTAHPDQAPGEKPDLVTVVRPLLDDITIELLAQLKSAAKTQASAHCSGKLALSAAQVKKTRHLDALHAQALQRAVSSVCARVRPPAS